MPSSFRLPAPMRLTLIMKVSKAVIELGKIYGGGFPIARRGLRRRSSHYRLRRFFIPRHCCKTSFGTSHRLPYVCRPVGGERRDVTPVSHGAVSKHRCVSFRTGGGVPFVLFMEVYFLKYIVYFPVIVHKGADLEIMQQFCVMMAEAKLTEVAHWSMYFKFQVAMGGGGGKITLVSRSVTVSLCRSVMLS